VNDNGFYQVSFGFGSGAAAVKVLQLFIDTVAQTGMAAFSTDINFLASCTQIIQLTGALPHTLELRFVSTGTLTLSAPNTQGPSVYLTVIKLF